MVYRQQYSVIGFLETKLLQTIENDIVAALVLHEERQLGGFYRIPRQVFCYVDYLGALCKGPPAATEKAMFFMDTYLATIDRRYKKFDRLIYEIWRHGTVHEFDPKRLEHTGKKYTIGTLANNDSTAPERACHLECFKVHATPIGM
jgi:hypothetical protein